MHAIAKPANGIVFKPATRTESKARIALTGPSGSGKTYTALALAHHFSDRIAVVDTERGRASLYVGINNWQFDALSPQAFSPASLTEIIAAAGDQGYGCLVVDSLSHYWNGVDGMLEQADKRAISGNTFSGWKSVRPDERRMIDALASYPGHVIVTLRVKTEYVLEENSRGKKVPRKVGLKPEQREGIEYEFDVVGDLDLDNTLTISKTRIPMLHSRIIPKPGAEVAEQTLEWLSEGKPLTSVMDYRAKALADGATIDELMVLWKEARDSNQLGAAVIDANGKTTSLGELIRTRGQDIKTAQIANSSVWKDSE